MRVEFHNPAKTRLYREGPSALIPFALLATCVPLGVWTLVSLLASGGPQTAFVAEAGWFAILALVYLSLHGLRGAAWVSVPVLLTIKALVQFLFIPLLRFAAGDDQLDAGYTHAMFLVLIGFAAFWIGSLVVKRESGLQFVPRFRDTPGPGDIHKRVNARPRLGCGPYALESSLVRLRHRFHITRVFFRIPRMAPLLSQPAAHSSSDYLY